MISAGKEDAADVEMLIKYGIDSNDTDTSGETELDKTAKQENLGCFEELRKGVYKIQSDEGGGSTLRWSMKNEECCRHSVEYTLKLFERISTQTKLEFDSNLHLL